MDGIAVVRECQSQKNFVCGGNRVKKECKGQCNKAMPSSGRHVGTLICVPQRVAHKSLCGSLRGF